MSNKIGFEMVEEERALHILETVTDISTAQFSEGFVGSVFTSEEKDMLVESLLKVNEITSNGIKRYEEKEDAD